MFVVSILAIFLALFIVSKSQPVDNRELVQNRFKNLSRGIESLVEKMEDRVQSMTQTNAGRGLTFSGKSFFLCLARVRCIETDNCLARRLSGLDDNVELKQPVVVMFAGLDQSWIDSLIAKYKQLAEKHTDALIVDTDCNSSQNRMDFEAHIFSQLRQAHGRHRLLILRNVERLSGASPLVLHSLADNESSPFKDIVILMTITVDKLPSLQMSDCTDVIAR